MGRVIRSQPLSRNYRVARQDERSGSRVVLREEVRASIEVGELEVNSTRETNLTT